MVFCDAGEYSSWLSCKTCPAGYACPHWIEGGKYKCGTGEYSHEGWERCQHCPAGYYCVNGGINACSPGLFQPENGASGCYRCEAGLWSGFYATGRPKIDIQTPE